MRAVLHTVALEYGPGHLCSPCGCSMDDVLEDPCCGHDYYDVPAWRDDLIVECIGCGASWLTSDWVG